MINPLPTLVAMAPAGTHDSLKPKYDVINSLVISLVQWLDFRVVGRYSNTTASSILLWNYFDVWNVNEVA